MRAGPWTNEELLRTLCAYAALSPEERAKPPKKLLIELRKQMPKRTLGSLAMRMSNFVARDPEVKHLQVAGLYGGGTHVDEIWNNNSLEDGTLDLRKLLNNAAQDLGRNLSEPDGSL